MDKKIIFCLLMLLCVFLSSCSQIVLKKAAQKDYSSKIREYFNLPVLFSYGVFFVATLVTVMALKYVPLSLAPVIESFGYVFITVLGVWVLREKISRRKLLGMLVIVTGVLVFSL